MWPYGETLSEALDRLNMTVGGKFPCPCCFYFELDDCPPGTFDICRVCGWEDDNVQFSDSTYLGGANRPSLDEARLNVQRFGTESNCADDRPRSEVPRALPPLQSQFWLAPLTKVTGGGRSMAMVGRLMEFYGVTADVLEAFIEQHMDLLRETNIFWERRFLTEQNRTSYTDPQLRPYDALTEVEADEIEQANRHWEGGRVWAVHRGLRYSLHEAEVAWKSLKPPDDPDNTIESSEG